MDDGKTALLVEAVVAEIVGIAVVGPEVVGFDVVEAGAVVEIAAVDGFDVLAAAATGSVFTVSSAACCTISSLNVASGFPEATFAGTAAAPICDVPVLDVLEVEAAGRI